MNKTYERSDGTVQVWRRFRRSTPDMPLLRYFPIGLNPTASARAVAVYRRRMRRGLR
jgi:hypothetical protein